MEPLKRKLLGFFFKHHRFPSYREMTGLFQVGGKSQAFRIVERWCKEGFLQKDETGHLRAGELQWHLPFLGSIEAGLPSDDALFGKSVALDDWLLEHERPTYLIRVNGNSMKDAAILDGDHVVVERTDKYEPGDIVIARVDGSWVIKFLQEDEQGKRFLRSSSDGYSDIHPSHELIIVAVVTAVIRRYRNAS